MTAENSLSKKPLVMLSALNDYCHPFDEMPIDDYMAVYGEEDITTALQVTDNLFLVIWGGEDISPSIYNHRKSRYTYAFSVPSRRDKLETELAMACIKLKIPIVGICRGAQLMCALSGGSLIQHVEGHTCGYHLITTSDGEELKCPSLHHQMMNPWTLEQPWEMLAWSSKHLSDVYYVEPTEKGEEVQMLAPEKEPEVIWIPGTKSLCIQSHPEFINDTKHPFVQYTYSLVKKLCLPTH